MKRDAQAGLGLIDVRRVRVSAWYGVTPVVGDQLRSRRARYLIVKVELRENGKPKAFGITRVQPGSVTSGREHPWVWDRGGRRHTSCSCRTE